MTEERTIGTFWGQKSWPYRDLVAVVRFCTCVVVLLEAVDLIRSTHDGGTDVTTHDKHIITLVL